MPAARILVIEDGSTVRRALKRLFESEGYSVDLAADRISGMKHLRKTAPLCDTPRLGLPEHEICQKIIQVAPRLPIIVLSAKTDFVEKAPPLEMGDNNVAGHFRAMLLPDSLRQTNNNLFTLL